MPEVISPELVLVSPDLRLEALLALPEPGAISAVAATRAGSSVEPQAPRLRQLWANAAAYLAMQLVSSLIWSVAAVAVLVAVATVVDVMR